MKAIFCVLALLINLLLIGSSATSQVIVDGVNINEIEDITMCQVLATQRLLSQKVIVTVNYGQEIKFAQTKGTLIKDQETGKNRIFNSTIAAINYMEQNGWEFIDAYSFAVGNQNVFHYYFRKKQSN